MSKCLIIIGMHRSGTSFTTSLLQNAGLNIGKTLLGEHKSNPKGHFENEDFCNFHRKILKENYLHPDGWDFKTISFQKEYEEEAKTLIAKNAHTYWGWKEPRTTLFLDFWKQLLPDACFLFIYRNPWEVIDSIYRRNVDNIFKNNPERAVDAWTFYNETILNFYINNRANSVLYNIKNVINQPETILIELNKRFGFELKFNEKKIFDEEIFNRTIINQNLQQIFVEQYSPEAVKLYRQLEQLNEGEKSWEDIRPVFIPDSKTIYQHWYQFDAAFSKINTLRDKISWMKESRFWKLKIL